jgi:hypothetical protein
MIRQLKTFEATCDECQKVVTHKARFASAPPGWGQRHAHNCGLRGYTLVEDLCPSCTRKTPVKASREQLPAG